MENTQPVAAAELDGANRTLLLPLWARAQESLQPEPLLADRRAAEIVAGLCASHGYQATLETLDKSLDSFFRLSQLIRARCIDDEIRAYLRAHPRATIVNIGAGLDTTFERVDNGQLRWYDLDLPDVIALRRQCLPDQARSTCIAKSVLDPTWYDEISHPQDGLMFVACGVLFFLTESEARQLLRAMALRFPGSEMVFDTMSSLFMAIGNRAVLGRGVIGTQARMRWAVQSATTLKAWTDRLEVVGEYPLYSTVRLNPAWGKAAVNRMRLINWMKGMNVCHLAFRPDPLKSSES